MDRGPVGPSRCRTNIAGYYPLGVEMHAVWAMLLGSPLGVRVGRGRRPAPPSCCSRPLPGHDRVRIGARESARAPTGRGRRGPAPSRSRGIPSAYDVGGEARTWTWPWPATPRWRCVASAAGGRPGRSRRASPGSRRASAARSSIKLKRRVPGAPAPPLPGPLPACPRPRGARTATSPPPGHGRHRGRAVVGALSLGVALAAPLVRAELDPYREARSFSPFYLGIWPAQAPGWDLERSATLRDPVLPLWRTPRARLRLPVVAHPPRGVGPAGPAPRSTDGCARHRFRPRALPLLAWALWRRRLDVRAAAGGFWCRPASSSSGSLLEPAAPLPAARDGPAWPSPSAVAGTGLAPALGRPLPGPHGRRRRARATRHVRLVPAARSAAGRASGASGGRTISTRRLDYYPLLPDREP